MPVQQMNITLSPQMARFIRSKVARGEYTNSSEVVRDALRRMQEIEASREDRDWLNDFERNLPRPLREGIKRRVDRGISDIERGRYEEFDAAGLRAVARDVVAASVKKSKRRSPAK